MWRIIPALLLIGFLIHYDATHLLPKPWRLALFTVCTLLALLCIPTVVAALRVIVAAPSAPPSP